MTNRIVHLQPDYLLCIVRRPAGWQPRSVEDVPRSNKILATHFVASYDEAYDDLVRCNQLSLERDLDRWAVIEAPSCRI